MRHLPVVKRPFKCWAEEDLQMINIMQALACMKHERTHSWMRQAGLPVVDRDGD